MRWILILIRLPFVLVLNAITLGRWSISAGFHWLVSLLPSPDTYVRVTLEEGLPLGRERRGLAKFFDNKTTFLELRRDLKRVAEDKRVKGVILESKSSSLGRVRSQDLVDVLKLVQASDKRIISSFDMAMTGEYVLMTVADDVTMTPAGRLYSFGARIEQLYFTPLLRRIGVTAQFVHIGAFKTAYNRFVRDSPAPGDAAMTADLRRSIDDLTAARISEHRNLDRDAVRELFKHAPVDPRWARRHGFIDHEAFSRDLPSLLEHGESHVHKPLENKKVPVISSLATWIDDQPRRLELRSVTGSKKRIAIIDLSGMIIMPGTNLPGGAQTIDPDDVLPVLRSIESGRWDGLLVHINSPGGSALASDIIWHALDEVRAKVPVVAYCSEVAGSGGYYLACGADQIVCRQESIIGSIGVITGKISGMGVLEHLGVERFVYQDQEAPPKMLSMTEPFDEEDLERTMEDAREFYRRFLHRVGVARHISKRRLHRYARGRVYLGQAALERGLVDSLDGFEGAVSRIYDLAGVEPSDSVKLSFVGIGNTSLMETLRAQLVPSFRNVAESAIGERVVDQALQPLVIARLLERESTLAISDVHVA